VRTFRNRRLLFVLFLLGLSFNSKAVSLKETWNTCVLGKCVGYGGIIPIDYTAWTQIPIKTKRKLNEFGVPIVPNCDSTNSVHQYLPNSRIIQYRENEEKSKEFLDLFEQKEQDKIPGCNCGHRFVAVVFHSGTVRTKMNAILSNSYFIPIQILTLGFLRIRWNEGYSQMRFLIYDCQEKRVVYNGINSRYLVPSDSISINKHLEIMLAKYKDVSDS
jgi:hypothetical protein